MPFLSPDIETFKNSLDGFVAVAQKQQTDSHAAIKIQSMLNVTVYVMATRFLEGSVKHVVYNCCKMKGFSDDKLSKLVSELRRFNNPEYSKIQKLVKDKLNHDISDGLDSGEFKQSDVTFLNQIVQNRHRNVHASSDSTEWYNQNKKDLSNFLQEYPGLISILEYLARLEFKPGSKSITLGQTLSPSRAAIIAAVPVTHTDTSSLSLWSRFKRYFS